MRLSSLQALAVKDPDFVRVEAGEDVLGISESDRLFETSRLVVADFGHGILEVGQLFGFELVLVLECRGRDGAEAARLGNVDRIDEICLPFLFLGVLRNGPLKVVQSAPDLNFHVLRIRWIGAVELTSLYVRRYGNGLFVGLWRK